MNLRPGADLSLPGQFVLSEEKAPPWPGWRSYPCGKLFLHAEQRLPVRYLLSQQGETLGLAAGWLIGPGPHGSLVTDDMVLPTGVSSQDTDRLEEWLWDLGGRFVVIILGNGAGRLYVDAGATLGTVFSPTMRRAGSTVTALLWDQPEHPLWSQALGVFPDDRPNQYYPAGTTADPEIHRLLPNHYLDLSTWQPVRHHPTHPPSPIDPREIPGAVDRIARLLTDQVRAVVEAAPRTYMPLTAGRDSRALLACSSGLHDRLEFVTFDYTPVGLPGNSGVDLRLSKEIARVLGLRHQVLPVPSEIPPGSALEYLRRIGFAGGSGKARDFFLCCQEHLDLSAAWVTGFGGEAWRVTHWRRKDTADATVTAEELLRRLGLPSMARFRTALQQWLEGLPPGLSLMTVLELAYIEHRLGGWASPHLYGAAPFQINLAPLCHRRIFDLVLGLPLAYKQKELNRAIVSTRLPALQRVPFNLYPGLRGFRQRAVSRVRRGLQKVPGRPTRHGV